MEKEGSQEVANFGRSLIVPSVQELAKNCTINIPSRYVNETIHHLGGLVDRSSTKLVPVIDLQKLLHGKSMESELENLHLACKDWGFFQITNHGLNTSFLETFKEEVIKFFQLPIEDKKKLWQTSDNQEGFGQLFVMREEQTLDWADIFYITTLPQNLRRPELINNLPQSLRVNLETYVVAMKTLAQTLLMNMGKALGMEEAEVKTLFSEGIQSLRMSYYPPCPQPQKTMGISPHSDADAVTILYQLNDIHGLEVRKDGNWVPIIPLKGSFLVNIGDIMEIVSNGMYRSIEHRATVNSTRERLSVATFYFPNIDSEVGPAKSIVTSFNPPVFKTDVMEKYHKRFFANELYRKKFLEEMKLQQGELRSI